MKAEISLSFNQILQLVKQLPTNQKIRLSKELEEEGIHTRLKEILEAFETNKLSQRTIDKEVEAVRQGIYDKKL